MVRFDDVTDFIRTKPLRTVLSLVVVSVLMGTAQAQETFAPPPADTPPPSPFAATPPPLPAPEAASPFAQPTAPAAPAQPVPPSAPVMQTTAREPTFEADVREEFLDEIVARQDQLVIMELEVKKRNLENDLFKLEADKADLRRQADIASIEHVNKQKELEEERLAIEEKRFMRENGLIAQSLQALQGGGATGDSGSPQQRRNISIEGLTNFLPSTNLSPGATGNASLADRLNAVLEQQQVEEEIKETAPPRVILIKREEEGLTATLGFENGVVKKLREGGEYNNWRIVSVTPDTVEAQFTEKDDHSVTLTFIRGL